MSMTLQEVIQLKADTYGSLRRAALILRIDLAYLSRLRSGKKTKPSKVTLRKLGVKEVAMYEILPQPKIRRTANG